MNARGDTGAVLLYQCLPDLTALLDILLLIPLHSHSCSSREIVNTDIIDRSVHIDLQSTASEQTRISVAMPLLWTKVSPLL